jgi:hypothetical protein
MNHTLIHGDCLKVLPTLGNFDCIFADPPDNIGLEYDSYEDKISESDYVQFLTDVITSSCKLAPIVWISFNARWTAQMGAVVYDHLRFADDTIKGLWTYRACTQVFTFGQHNQHWLGNNHRPLWCIYRRDATFYPDSIRVPSWRQLNGDKRADPRGRVPGDVCDMQYGEDRGPIDWQLILDELQVSNDYRNPPPACLELERAISRYSEGMPGDVFDFPRVTGNSKQRQSWHPTQLNQDLVERVIKFSTPDGGSVLDPFAGTGTTLRVCQKINRNCTTIEMDNTYCERIAADCGLAKVDDTSWATAA